MAVCRMKLRATHTFYPTLTGRKTGLATGQESAGPGSVDPGCAGITR